MNIHEIKRNVNDIFISKFNNSSLALLLTHLPHRYYDYFGVT